MDLPEEKEEEEGLKERGEEGREATRVWLLCLIL